jgi:hypothetical protein
MLELITALALAGSTPLTKGAAPDSVALWVRVYAHKQIDEATIRRSLQVADELLAPAGLIVAWRVCTTPDSCPVQAAAAPEIVVILSAQNRQKGGETCGLAARAARDSAGTVMVWVPCVRDAAFRLTRRPGTGTNPLLAMPRHDDLVGAIVAHEIGHLLGASHADAGLMRRSLEIEDIVALRKGVLRFSAAEARGMRLAAIGWDGSPTLVGRRLPCPPSELQAGRCAG